MKAEIERRLSNAQEVRAKVKSGWKSAEQEGRHKEYKTPRRSGLSVIASVSLMDKLQCTELRQGERLCWKNRGPGSAAVK